MFRVIEQLIQGKISLLQHLIIICTAPNPTECHLFGTEHAPNTGSKVFFVYCQSIISLLQKQSPQHYCAAPNLNKFHLFNAEQTPNACCSTKYMPNKWDLVLMHITDHHQSTLKHITKCHWSRPKFSWHTSAFSAYLGAHQISHIQHQRNSVQCWISFIWHQTTVTKLTKISSAVSAYPQRQAEVIQPTLASLSPIWCWRNSIQCHIPSIWYQTISPKLTKNRPKFFRFFRHASACSAPSQSFFCLLWCHLVPSNTFWFISVLSTLIF